MTAADTPELTTRDCKDWALAYADLAAKLAAAEREWEELLETAQCQSDRAARAEAALVAAQEAMREVAAKRCESLREEGIWFTYPRPGGPPGIQHREAEISDAAAAIRALPIPATKPEGE